VSRRLIRQSADVEHVQRVVRRIEYPELRPVRQQHEPVAGRVRPELRVPGEPFEANDVTRRARSEIDDANAESPSLRDVHGVMLRVGDRQVAVVEGSKPASRQVPCKKIERVDASGRP
jgi:hypothetical protein